VVVTQVVLSGEFKKDELLEAARSGNEEQLMELLTPLNVNCHASDGRKSTPLHLAAGYNRVSALSAGKSLLYPCCFSTDTKR